MANIRQFYSLWRTCVLNHAMKAENSRVIMKGQNIAFQTVTIERYFV